MIVFEKSADVYSLDHPLQHVGTVADQWAAQVDAAPLNGDVAADAALMGKITHTIGARQRLDQQIACRYIAQNQASNAAIMQLKITVQSAIGSWTFRGDSYPFQQDRDLLWKRHVQNCNDDYMKAGRGAWQQRGSCALLSCSDFLLGISTGPGVIFPIILDCECVFANKAAITSGLCFTNGQVKGRMVFEDFICGQPVLVGLFDQQILSIASSSAVLSAQSFSQSTFAAAQQQRR